MNSTYPTTKNSVKELTIKGLYFFMIVGSLTMMTIPRTSDYAFVVLLAVLLMVPTIVALLILDFGRRNFLLFIPMIITAVASVLGLGIFR